MMSKNTCSKGLAYLSIIFVSLYATHASSLAQPPSQQLHMTATTLAMDNAAEKAVNSMPSFNIEEFGALVNDFFTNKKPAKGESIITLLGPTGEGKSTSATYLLGKKLAMKRKKKTSSKQSTYQVQADSDDSDVEQVIDLAEPVMKGSGNATKVPGIGHTKESHTLHPEIFKATNSPFAYCDCPGLFDNRGDTEKFAIAVTTGAVIAESKEVKAVVFVISWPTLTGVRGKIFREVAQALQNIFENPKKHARSVFFLFTKPPYNNNGKRYKLKKYVEEIISIYESAEKNMAKNEDQALLYDITKQILDNQQNLFLIKPLDNGKSRKKIIEGLKKSPPIPTSEFTFFGDDTLRKEVNRLFGAHVMEAKKQLDRQLRLPKDIATLRKNIEDNRKVITNTEKTMQTNRDQTQNKIYTFNQMQDRIIEEKHRKVIELKAEIKLSKARCNKPDAIYLAPDLVRVQSSSVKIIDESCFSEIVLSGSVWHWRNIPTCSCAAHKRIKELNSAIGRYKEVIDSTQKNKHLHATNEQAALKELNARGEAIIQARKEENNMIQKKIDQLQAALASANEALHKQKPFLRVIQKTYQFMQTGDPGIKEFFKTYAPYIGVGNASDPYVQDDQKNDE